MRRTPCCCEKAFGAVYSDGVSRPPLPTRLMAALAIDIQHRRGGARWCCRQAVPYLRNNCIASSAKTPPVIVIGTNAAFAAISALEIMI
jgi:hypothetical protein